MTPQPSSRKISAFEGINEFDCTEEVGFGPNFNSFKPGTDSGEEAIKIRVAVSANSE